MMYKPFRIQILRAVALFFATGTIYCCTSTSDDKNSPTENKGAGGQIDTTATVDTDISDLTTIFTVIGDVPYNEDQRAELVTMIDAHNTKAESEFIVHVGDIKPGADPCDESIFKDVNGLLKNFEKPTFIVLGDNEYNDCDDPDSALTLWNRYFLHFNENWEFQHAIAYQEARPENFAWVENSVLFLGLNLVGSTVHDQAEWDKRLADDADWTEAQFEIHKDSIQAAVLFGHANMNEVGPEKFEPFTDRFRVAAKAFDRPVLYMQGDGHFWLENRPWPEQNILRVQIEGGGNAVEVTVNLNLENPFVFNREFLD